MHVNLGPMKIGHGGVAVQPKCDVGFKIGEFEGNVGVPNLQNGLGLDLKIGATKVVQGKGKTVWAAFHNLKTQEGLSKEVDDALTFLTKLHPTMVLQKIILEKLKVDINQDFPNVVLRAKAKATAGGDGKLALPFWKDDEGFYMEGVGGGVAVLMELGASVFVGCDDWEKPTKYKVIVGFPHCEFTVKFAEPAKKEPYYTDVIDGDNGPATQKAVRN